MSGLAPLRNVQKPGALRTPSGELLKSKTFRTSTGSAEKTNIYSHFRIIKIVLQKARA